MTEMPKRFRKLATEIHWWAAIAPDNVIVGKILEKQERRGGPRRDDGQPGELYLIELTEKCAARATGDPDGAVDEAPVGDVVALDVRAGLTSLEKYVGDLDAEIWIRPIEKTRTRDGNSFWRFELGATK